MTTIEQIFMPTGVIASIFWITWQIKYPSEVWRALRFRDGDIILGIGTWLFLFGFTATVKTLCYKFLG
jgi:hypothetical protein